MKVEQLYDCITNSWHVQKHWDAIIKVLLIAKQIPNQELQQAIEELEMIK